MKLKCKIFITGKANPFPVARSKKHENQYDMEQQRRASWVEQELTDYSSLARLPELLEEKQRGYDELRLHVASSFVVIDVGSIIQ
jgi:hypothetical protein